MIKKKKSTILTLTDILLFAFAASLGFSFFSACLPTLISLWNSRPWERRSHTCSSCLPVYLLSAGRCMLTYREGILSSWPFKRMRANAQQKPGGREEASSDSGGGMQAGWVPLSESVRIRVRTMWRFFLFFFCLCLFCFFGVHWIKICWMLSAERCIYRQNDFFPPSGLSVRLWHGRNVQLACWKTLLSRSGSVQNRAQKVLAIFQAFSGDNVYAHSKTSWGWNILWWNRGNKKIVSSKSVGLKRRNS